jgi:hypothetical protein
MLTRPVYIPEEFLFFPVCARGTLTHYEFGRPVVVIDGERLVLFDHEIRKSPW